MSWRDRLIPLSVWILIWILVGLVFFASLIFTLQLPEEAFR
jgi:hypothetical protein